MKRVLTMMHAALAVALGCALTASPSARAAVTNTYYVWQDAPNSASPYGSWDTAATNIFDAVAKAHLDVGPGTNGVIVVTNGTYVLTNSIELSKAILLRSVNGRDVTTLDANASAETPRRVLTLTHAEAEVDGFTIRRGYTLGTSHTVGNPGGGIYMTGGTVRNCAIVSNTTTYYGGGVCMTGGQLLDCIVASNSIPTTTRTGCCHQPDGGGGVYCGAATVRRCTIFDNRNIACASGYNSGGGGVCLYGGTLADSVIRGNSVTMTAWGGGNVLVRGGVISNCLVTASVGTSQRALGVQLQSGQMVNCAVTNNNGWAVDCEFGATIRNTLIARNSGLGLRMQWGGSVESSTIANNTGNGIDRTFGNGGTVALLNSIVYGNTAGDFGTGTKSVTMNYSCSSTTNFPGGNNIQANPGFVAAAAGDFRLGRNSPCIDKGQNQAWMTGAYDLDGQRRVKAGTVDMGAYESDPPPGTVITIR